MTDGQTCEGAGAVRGGGVPQRGQVGAVQSPGGAPRGAGAQHPGGPRHSRRQGGARASRGPALSGAKCSLNGAKCSLNGAMLGNRCYPFIH